MLVLNNTATLSDHLCKVEAARVVRKIDNSISKTTQQMVLLLYDLMVNKNIGQDVLIFGVRHLF